MKKFLLLMLFITVLTAFLIPFSVSAEQSGTFGTALTWVFDDTGTLTISGTGEMDEFNPFSNNPPWYSSRESISTVAVSSGITSIGDYAFYGCSSLAAITIPSSVTSIGYYAFSGCTSLENVYISDISAYLNISFNDFPMKYADKLYINNELVTSLVIPDGIETIPDYAFSGCASLTGITIPSSVTSIGGFAFSDCTGLTTVNYEGTENDFSNISIGLGNEPLQNAVINYGVQITKIISTTSTWDSLGTELFSLQNTRIN